VLDADAPLWQGCASVAARCECGEGSPLVRATIPGTLGHCDGGRPWLGPNTRESCDAINRLLVRHASNAYFPQIMSVISLPDRNESLEKAVNQVWEHHLQFVDTLDELKKDRGDAAIKVLIGDNAAHDNGSHLSLSPTPRWGVPSRAWQRIIDR
jgi:hypothetical protein